MQNLLILSRQKLLRRLHGFLKLFRKLKVPKSYFKKISDTDFYEVRIELSGNIYRLPGFFHNGNIVILTNGFQKKTQKTPENELDICEKRMKDYINRGKR